LRKREAQRIETGFEIVGNHVVSVFGIGRSSIKGSGPKKVESTIMAIVSKNSHRNPAQRSNTFAIIPAQIPLGRTAPPSEIAALMLWLVEGEGAQ